MAVHDIVVLHHIFTLVKVKALNFFLGRFKATGNHTVFNRHIFVNLQPVEYFANPFCSKYAHKVVFGAHIKLGCSRVALSASATTQLVVYAARFMSFATNHEQSTELLDALAKYDVGTATSNVGCERDGPFLASFGHYFRFAFVIFCVQNLMRHTRFGEHATKFFILFYRNSTN